MTLYYLTRTFSNRIVTENASGLRDYTVHLLRKRYKTIVVTPNYKDEERIIQSDYISFPFKMRRMDSYLQRVGLYEDYLFRWVNETYKYLKNQVSKNDIVFATSGGELGCIMLASKLKRACGCKVIINFHDPIDASTVNGIQTSPKLNINRDRFIKKHIKNADYIITCCKTYQSALMSLSPNRICPLKNVYRGFRGDPLLIKEKEELHYPINLVFGGTMSLEQGAECFGLFFADREDITVTYVGKASEEIERVAKLHDNIKLIPSLPHDKYLEYMLTEADVGLVTLKGLEYAACVPSKIFELINLEIPIFAILPEGDASDIINNGYGVSCSIRDKSSVCKALDSLLESSIYQNAKEKMREDKGKWQMEELFKDIYYVIDCIGGNI